MSTNKLQLAVGAVTLLTAAGTLLALLLPHITTLVLSWVVVEVVFWVLVTSPTADHAAHINAQPAGGHWPSTADATAAQHFARFLKYCKEAPGRVCHKKYLGGWFQGADIETIKRGNIEEFVAYGFCYKSREQLAAEGRGDIPSKWTDQLEAVWGIKAPPGYNPNITFMAHLWHPLNAAYRPLLFYLFMEFIAYCSRHYLKYQGYRHHRHAGINYYTLHLHRTPKPPAQLSPSKTSGASSKASADAAAAAAAVNEASVSGSPASAGDTKGALGGNTPKLAPAPPAAMRPRSSTRQQQRSLLPIPEQSAQQPQEQDRQVPTALSDAAAAAADTAAEPPAEPWFGLDDSPFAAAEAPAELVAAMEAAAAAGVTGMASIAPQAADASADAGNSCAKTKSLPALHQATAEENKGLKNLQHRLKSCSALPGHTGNAPRRPTPLQAALSEALTEAGIIEAGVPVVFLHGIGGLPAYLELLNYLKAEGSPLLAVEVKSVGMRLGPVYTVDKIASAILGMMDIMRVRQACFVAHSYGTFIASYIAKHHRERMRGCVLIDAVCMGMFMPNLTYNFLYKEPVWQGWGKESIVAYIKAFVRTCISRELHVRASVSRGFYWTELNAWPEDLPAGSTVLLSGKDDLMDSPEVEQMLKGAAHLKVRYNQDLTHGAFLLNKEVKQAVRTELMSLLATSGKAVVGLARQLSVMVQPAVLPNQASFVVRNTQSPAPSGGLAAVRSSRSWSVGRGSWGRTAVGSWQQKSELSRASSEGVGSFSAGSSVVDGGSSSGELEEADTGCGSNGNSSRGQEAKPQAEVVDGECDVAARRPDQ